MTAGTVREPSKKEVKRFLQYIIRRYEQMSDNELMKEGEQWIKNPPLAATEYFRALKSELEKRISNRQIKDVLLKLILTHYPQI